MSNIQSPVATGIAPHNHVFLGEGHERNERRTWFVIVLCGIMMLIEIVGGIMFGSIALVADGLHMSTHAGALLLAAMAYTFSRRYASDPRFTFGTGKLGDLAGFTSAIVLAMIALLIGYESVTRLLAPVPIHFGEAIPIAILGLGVNVASAWLLSAGGHDHGHSHGHVHSHGHDDHDEEHEDEAQRITVAGRAMLLSIHEDGVPPRFRLTSEDGVALPSEVTIETVRDGDARQRFVMVARAGYLESRDEIPEPHAFAARIDVAGQVQEVRFEEHDHDHGAHHRDNNMRAAVIHVVADAAVSVLVIVGLILARTFGWLWMDPIAGLIGAAVIASWSYGLVRDTGAILLDMLPNARTADRLRREIEGGGDQVVDLHLWRLGPGHLGAIVAVATGTDRDAAFYRERLAHIPSLSHLTVEVNRAAT
ncbi:CDF family Co(II)/Ni(II) efflux transporter DmeF [uncultured Sphingomonas sp.]|uniref:CDF family Co(II)/Ni(II) efflux transporter DmeF n=1 Tax=uncultured Sphingomonas sp. TaxID=158754 RepID=UPI0035CA6E5F